MVSKYIIDKYGSEENYKKHVSKALSGKHFYTNGIEDRKFADDEEIPEGWVKGRTNFGKGTSNYIWINNGIDRKFISKDQEIPEGWVKGNLKFTEEHKQNLSKALRGKTRTEEQKERIKKAHNTNTYKENIKQSRLKLYGVENFFQNKDIQKKAEQNAHTEEAEIKRKSTCKNHFDVDYPMQSNEVKQTLKKNNLTKYGVEYSLQIPEVRENIKQTCLKKYGVNCPLKSEQIKDKIKQTCLKKYNVDNVAKSEIIQKKIINTNNKIRGVNYPLNDPSVLEKQIQTNLDRYNVMYNIQLPQSHRYSSKNSKPNRDFAKLLDSYNIKYDREFALNKYSFDFKVDDILIEINPSATHNTLWGPFGSDHKGIDVYYHYNKTKTAIENNYRIIHIFDWDNKNKIIHNILLDKPTIYARNTSVVELSTKETNEFLNTYHLQGRCNGQKVCLGLKDKNNNIVTVMTFGKPRYNKHYQWELLRYCSNSKVIGGPKKLFKYFIEHYNPMSIISYCDKSKFEGNIYRDLHFNLILDGQPMKHWHNPQEKLSHITDNFLRQRGFDQLFGTSYGKGTSNEQLIIDRGYLPIYDCGQNTYVWVNH